jgi:hypothetical protein
VRIVINLIINRVSFGLRKDAIGFMLFHLIERSTRRVNFGLESPSDLDRTVESLRQDQPRNRRRNWPFVRRLPII